VQVLSLIYLQINIQISKFSSLSHCDLYAALLISQVDSKSNSKIHKIRVNHSNLRGGVLRSGASRGAISI
jgi:hypothetical protein